jgi:DMSO/TMAO reductase YedYZ molybdopterin-dependent catalytic subunit
MKPRRQFIKTMLRFLAGAGIMFSPLMKAARVVYAAAQKIILPRDTDRHSLIDRNPGNLDTRNLQTTPLKDFGVMGLSDYEVDLNAWRLEVTGSVKTPLQLTYSQVLSLPSIERNVLLICPGVFANHGRWKGISIAKLLEQSNLEQGVTYVAFSGPPGNYTKEESFPIAEIRSDQVFLAYAVNGEALPRQHGFPLRLVAEGHYGAEWVKYVYKVEALKS